VSPELDPKCVSPELDPIDPLGGVVFGAGMVLSAYEFALATVWASRARSGVMTLVTGFLGRMRVWRAIARKAMWWGASLLSAGSLLAALRVIITHEWLPTSSGGAVAWFALAELFLMPAGVLLLTVSLLVQLWVTGEGSAAPVNCFERTATNLICIVVVFAVLLLIASQVTLRILPALSRRLEWGRFGYPPPVRLGSLDKITSASGMHFPLEAKLIDGEYIGSGPHPYLIAEVQMPRDRVETYFKQQRAPFSWGDVSAYSRTRTGAISEFPWWLDVMRKRGWRPDLVRRAVLAQANTAPRAADFCNVLIDLDHPRHAVLYIYWEQT